MVSWLILGLEDFTLEQFYCFLFFEFDKFWMECEPRSFLLYIHKMSKKAFWDISPTTALPQNQICSRRHLVKASCLHENWQASLLAG